MPENEQQEVDEQLSDERPPSAETKNADKKAEHMIPKSRLDAEIAKLAKAEEELEKLRNAEAERRKAEMTELDRLKLEKEEADKRVEKAEGKYRELELQIDFENTADALNVVFVSKQAAQDAYKFLDPDILKDGMQKALEALRSKRPYLFSETVDDEGESSTDARQKGSRNGTRDVLDRERERDLRAKYQIRRPR